MIVNEKQVRQLYVVSSKVTTTPAATGEVQVKSGDNMAWLSYFGAEDLMRSDLILKGMVVSGKTINAADLGWKRKAYKVVASEAAQADTDYILRIKINQAFGTSDQDTYCKFAVVSGAAASATGANFYNLLAKSLVENFRRENTKWFTFYVAKGTTLTEVNASTDWSTIASDNDAVVIEEAAQSYRIGALDQVPVYFTLEPGEGKTSGIAWGTATAVTSTDYATLSLDMNNSVKTAELEHFLMGERGDQYRQVGYPYTIDTKYLVDPTNAKGYAYLELNYYWAGGAEDVNKSPKTITLVAKEDASKTGIKLLNQIATALETPLNITFTKASEA